MKLTRTLFMGLLVLAVSGMAIANASARRPTARRAQSATVELRETSLGTILVSSSGFTLFEFTKDKRTKEKCVTITGCPEVWPPLEVTGAPTAGVGVNAALLSTITLPGGERQVTYKGHPLYMYSRDIGPGETSYVGAFEFGGYWYALKAKGQAVR